MIKFYFCDLGLKLVFSISSSTGIYLVLLMQELGSEINGSDRTAFSG